MFTEITNILNNFFEEEGIECTCEVALDFAYYYTTDVITYSLVTTETTDRLFTQFAQDNGLEYDCGIFLLSLLHEVGHYYTIDEVDEKTERKCERIKSKLSENKEEDCLKYFALDDEIIATEWAIDYINNNREKLEILSKKLQEAIDKIVS